MLEDILKEINELLKYKEKYNSLIKDREKMAEYIYQNELKDYFNTSYENRCKKYIEETCKCCRYNGDCNFIDEGLRADILEPIKNKDWFPSYKNCGGFEWS